MRKHPQELKDKILTLWNANMSSQRVADRVGLTKNAVISILKKMRDNGVHVRVGKSPNKNPYKKPRAPRSYKRALPQVPMVYESPKNFRSPNYTKNSKDRWVPLLHLSSETCRYTKDGKLFCNAPCNNHHSYCDEHGPTMYSGHYTIRVNLRPFRL